MKTQNFLPLLSASLFVLISSCFAAPTRAHARVTKVGNGDEGSDLEGATLLERGPIVAARSEALKLALSLNVGGIAGLGSLTSELENSKLYLTKKNSTAIDTADQGSFHADMQGLVYARTFAEPSAATRFFPVAETLSGHQLVALHLHEALHRSLPASVREDEEVVSLLTLAMSAPGATFDSVERAAKKVIPREKSEEVGTSDGAGRYPIPEDARVRQPSEFSYSYRHYRQPTRASLFPVESMHVLRSDLYPFGSDTSPIGIGIEAGLIQRTTGSLMGPLSLSARGRVWSSRGFDVGIWGVASLNTLSAEELKNSQYGRDAYTIGLSMKKDLAKFSIENFLSYTASGSSQQKIGAVNYAYDYGSVVTVSLHPAALVGPFRVGGFAELNLGDHYRVNGGAFTYDPGRYRIVSGGPEIQFVTKDFSLGLSARFLIDATRDASFDSLGDLMGPGLAQGNVAFTGSIFF
ncbi:MAG: hypothetical protein H7301_06880 [Cryobacterium sp.]|nr:hypothetical protein [Oligoflexia bacterium]